MKKLNTWLFCVALTFGLSACNSVNPDEQLTNDIVGSYYYVETLDDDDDNDLYDITMQGTEKFNADKTCSEQLILMMTTIDDDWDEIDIELKFNVSGTWSIKDSCIQYNYAIDKTTIEVVKPVGMDNQMREYLKKHFLLSINESLIKD